MLIRKASIARLVFAVLTSASFQVSRAEFSEVTLLETGYVHDTSPGFSSLEKGQAVKLTETFHFNNFQVTNIDPVNEQYAYRFSAAIDGVLVAGVHTIDGLESESDIVEYKDGEDGTMHTRPGNHKAGKMSVTKDWSNTSEWYKWRFGGPTKPAGPNDDADSFASYFGQIHFNSNTMSLTDDAGNRANITLTTSQAVPEPATLSAALLGLTMLRKRRRTSPTN